MYHIYKVSVWKYDVHTLNTSHVAFPCGALQRLVGLLSVFHRKPFSLKRILFFGTRRSRSLMCCMLHRIMVLYQDISNNDPGTQLALSSCLSVFHRKVFFFETRRSRPWCVVGYVASPKLALNHECSNDDTRAKIGPVLGLRPISPWKYGTLKKGLTVLVLNKLKK